MKSLINILQEKLCHQQVDEKLVITKDTKDKNYNLSFDQFIRIIREKMVYDYEQYTPSLNGLKSLFTYDFNKDADKLKYNYICKEDRNHWEYKKLFEYCEELINSPSKYKLIHGIKKLEAGMNIYIFRYIDFSLNGNGEYYVFFINANNKTYDIYKAVK